LEAFTPKDISVEKTIGSVYDLFMIKAYKILAFVCIILFIFLCFFHYFSQRPLWEDERYILNNIRNLSFRQLFGPLQQSQAFPRVYLAGIKLFSKVFNHNVLSLRFFPFLSGLGAFFIWRKVYQESFNSRWLSLLALFSLSSSYYFSYYAAELKQYSLDLLVVGLFCLYLTYQRKAISLELKKTFVVTTLLLPFTLFISYAGFLVFWMVIYNFLLSLRENRKIVYLMLGYIVISVLVAISVNFIDLRHNLTSQGLIGYWKDYFICTDSVYCFFKSFTEGLRKLSTWWFGNIDFLKRSASFVIPFFVISLFVYGSRSLKDKAFRFWTIESIGFIIFMELVILGMLKKYPFTGERITLFFAPFVFYFIIKGINSLKKVKILYRFFIISYLGLVLGSGLNSFITYLKLYN